MQDDNARNRSDDTFSHGNYIQVALLFDKNATREYSKSIGAVGSVVLANDNGVFEVAARVSYLCLVGSGRYGGDEYNYTTGVSWYMNENVRLSSNLTYVDINARASQNDWVWQNRFQVCLLA